MKTTYLFFGTVFIILFMFGLLVLTEFISINSITIKAEDKMIAAAWSGFTEIDFNELAIRRNQHNLSDEETRDIYLDKDAAKIKIREYIKDNFELDDSYMPKDSSFIYVKDHPIIIDTLEIYNPDNYNSSIITVMGQTIDRTSIYILFRIPIKVAFVGNLYKEIGIVADSKSFYSLDQR